MKVALCISGYFTNKNNDDLLKTNYIYDNIINKIDTRTNSLDIFIHSFDKNSESNINQKYPYTKKTVIEDQINFLNKLSNKNIDYYNKLKDCKYDENTSYNVQSTLSMLYSRCLAINLALNYSTEYKFEFDVIIRVRFDIGVRLKKPFNGYKPDDLIFDVDKYNYNYFYSSYWNQLNAGYADHWEFSNSKNMKKFAEIYNYVMNNMLHLKSLYINALDNWPDSNNNNEFTNIILDNNQATGITKKYDFIHSINNHLIEKYFMIESKMYLQSAFLDFTFEKNIDYRIINNYCILLYSHSDCYDLWDLTFNQIYKYINLDQINVIFCVDNLKNYKIDNRITVIYYDNSQIYTDRILSTILDLKYDYILFLHEDWVITNTFDHYYIHNIIKFMNSNEIKHVRSYQNYGFSNNKPHIFKSDSIHNINICNIPNDSGNFISLQPGIWNINVLIELYTIKAVTASKLETTSNDIFKQKYKDTFFYETDSKLAQQSIMFPHIHTIAYGRWAMCNDSYNVLDSLLDEYNIDKKIRGYFNLKTGEEYLPIPISKNTYTIIITQNDLI